MGLPNIGPVELIIILVIALLILGPGKLPEVGSAFGKTIREFRKASSDIQETASVATKPVTEAAAAVSSVAAAPPPPPAPASAASAPAAPAPTAPAGVAATADPVTPVVPAGTPVDAIDERV